MRVGSGSVLGQAVIIGASPLLTRLFDPSDYGIYAIYLAVVTVVGTVACLRFDIAIPIPRSEGVALALARLALVALVGSSLIVGLIGGLVAAFSLEPLAGYPPSLLGSLLTIGVLGYGGYLLLTSWAVRRHLFGLLGVTRLTRALGQTLIQLGIGVAGPASGLLIGHAAGHLFGQFALGRDLLVRLRRARIVGARLRWAARRYRRYVLFSAPAALVNSLGLHLAPVVLVAFFEPAVAGLYAVAQRVIGSPAAIVGGAISQVFFGRVVEFQRDRPARVRGALLTTMAVTAAIGLVPLAAIALGGPSLFAFLLGDEWRLAGRYVQILTPMFLLQFAVYPVSLTLNAVGRPDLQLIYDVFRLFAGIGTLALLGLRGASPESALTGFAAGMSVGYLFYASLALWAVSRPKRPAGHGDEREPRAE